MRALRLEQGSRAWQAGFSATLALAMATGTFAVYAFGVLAPFLLAEFQISRSRLGWLTALVNIVGGGGSIVAGKLVDNLGGRRVLLGSFTLVALVTVAMAWSPSFAWMSVGAAAAGVALATGNPVTNKLVAVHIPAGARGAVIGFKQAGVQMGAFLAGLLLPWGAQLFGWRVAYGATAALGLVGVFLGRRLIPPDPPPERRERASPQNSAVVGREPLPPAVIWIASYAFLMGSGVAAIGAHLTLYGNDRVGLSVGAAGTVASVMGATGVAARIAWGWGAERTRGPALPLLLLALGSLAAVPLALAATATAGLLWVAAVAFGATAVSWNAVGMLAVVQAVHQRDAGRASGWILLGFYAGFVPAPILFGWSVDVTGDYVAGWTGVAVAFLLAAGIVAAWRRGMGGRP